MENILIFALVACGCVLLAWAFTQFSAPRSKFKKKQIPEQGVRGDPGCCPVCGTRLSHGEQIKTVVYPPAVGSTQTDKVCHIFGCPYCYPIAPSGIQRQCPVCGDPIPKDSYLIARMFIKNQQKSHVHVNGCLKCSYGNKRKI